MTRIRGRPEWEERATGSIPKDLQLQNSTTVFNFDWLIIVSYGVSFIQLELISECSNQLRFADECFHLL